VPEQVWPSTTQIQPANRFFCFAFFIECSAKFEECHFGKHKTEVGCRFVLSAAGEAEPPNSAHFGQGINAL
jgi:hypothetical protein